MDESDNQRVPVGVLLEGLRAKFAELNLLPGGRVEIYDRKEHSGGDYSDCQRIPAKRHAQDHGGDANQRF